MDGDLKEEEQGRVLKLAGHLNCAICHLKLSEFEKCIEECEKVSEMS